MIAATEAALLYNSTGNLDAALEACSKVCQGGVHLHHSWRRRQPNGGSCFRWPCSWRYRRSGSRDLPWLLQTGEASALLFVWLLCISCTAFRSLVPSCAPGSHAAAGWPAAGVMAKRPLCCANMHTTLRVPSTACSTGTNGYAQAAIVRRVDSVQRYV